MHDMPLPDERAGQPVSGDGPEADYIDTPPAGALFDVVTVGREVFDRFHIAVLEALYDLELAGRSPSNEEDLEGQLGYSDGAEFRRDRPLIEAVLTDLQHLQRVDIDGRYVITLTATGRHIVMRARGRCCTA